MDPDYISVLERFITQIKYFLDHPEVDVVGSDVIEIYESGGEL